MIIRKIEYDDIPELQELYNKFKECDGDFPNFFENFIGNFIIRASDNNIIMASGLRVIPECVVIMNKDAPVRMRRQAMYIGTEICKELAKSTGQTHIHAYIQSDRWARHVQKLGFEPYLDKVLVLSV
jgi:N-acetylglutamate synthase-like GNAT family acetyltransferase